MDALHPHLRSGLAEDHVRRLAEDRLAPVGPGPTRRLLARLFLATGTRLAGCERTADHASSASFTSVSAS